jgi:hypothetical protein
LQHKIGQDDRTRPLAVGAGRDAGDKLV